jgi:hypothetical protein
MKRNSGLSVAVYNSNHSNLGAEVGWFQITHLRQFNSKNKQNKKTRKNWGTVQVVEHFSSKHEALGSVLSTTKHKRDRQTVRTDEYDSTKAD